MMKSFVVAAVTIFAVASVSADSFFRVDISGVSGKSQVKISSPADKSANLKLIPQGWVKNAKVRACTLTGETKIADKDGWKTYTFTVKAEKNAKINFAFTGNWAPKREQMTWVQITDFKMNGKLVANGDFAKLDKNKQPVGFRIQNVNHYIPAAKKDDKNSVTVNHNSRVFRDIDLQAGKTYTFSVMVKAAKAPAKAPVKK